MVRHLTKTNNHIQDGYSTDGCNLHIFLSNIDETGKCPEILWFLDSYTEVTDSINMTKDVTLTYGTTANADVQFNHTFTKSLGSFVEIKIPLQIKFPPNLPSFEKVATQTPGCELKLIQLNELNHTLAIRVNITDLNNRDTLQIDILFASGNKVLEASVTLHLQFHPKTCLSGSYINSALECALCNFGQYCKTLCYCHFV
jgi:hypothetical protein